MVKEYEQRAQVVRHLKVVARPTHGEKDGFQRRLTSSWSYKRVEAVGRASHCRELRIRVLIAAMKSQLLRLRARHP
jgi:hypothetical protein